ncbi:MAG TPA: iron donor protein CyaY [Candidatus Kapabacteria bacterium]|jgi:CyaY protein|nr:iron donor protein CyaY [Candidatus Kapabacteria bacterium]
MSQFSLHYDSTIRELERKLGDLIDDGAEFDIERNGDVLVIEFEDGEKIVITPQAPMEQLWVSANYAGHRFNWSEDKWKNEKGSEEFIGFLSRVLSEKLGSPIEI